MQIRAESFLTDLLGLIRKHFLDTLLEPSEGLTVTFIATNDKAVQLAVSAGVDRDGVQTALPATVALTATVDRPDVATVSPVDGKPNVFLVRPLPSADPAAGKRTVVVTFTDPAAGVTTASTVEFDPGAETSLVVTPTLVDIAPPSNGVVTGADTQGAAGAGQTVSPVGAGAAQAGTQPDGTAAGGAAATPATIA